MQVTARRSVLAFAFVVGSLSALAQEEPAVATAPQWTFHSRLEIRANYRDSDHEKFPLRFAFPPSMLPAGEVSGSQETVDPGRHFELNVVQVQLESRYGSRFTARVKAHALDKYRRNPTSSDKKIDADEFWVRFGEKPEFLDRPAGTSLFLQLGKAPKMERQPVRLLESYGLAATSFNRFEDIQALAGGTLGRNFYWRLQAANGNPLFFRDSNALAGDNGTPELRNVPPNPKLHSGFPILYNAETEGYWFDTSHIQLGEALGYRWLRGDESFGYDLIAFHYRRSLADEEHLTGTFYGGDLDLLRGPLNAGLPLQGRTKEEYGARLYSEWREGTLIAQFTRQRVAGLERESWELETGYRFGTPAGPNVAGESLLQYIQPAARLSGITNRFRGNSFLHPAPSIWWQWTKIDAGVRVGLAKNVDVTVEYSKHNIGAIRKLNEKETLVTVRARFM